MNKIIIVSAPSGSGKSTLIGKLMQDNSLKLEFSVSATTRLPRGNEKNGIEYYFYSPEEFKKLIKEDALIEYEEVYTDRFYGTLKSEINRIFEKGHNVIFDVDVEGGINLKKIFQKDALSIFIQPPSIEELEKRLINRKTDSTSDIEKRINKASLEITRADMFDIVVINDDLDKAFGIFKTEIETFLQK